MSKKAKSVYTEEKPINPHTRRTLIQARVNTKEMQEILTRALMYCNGDVSKYVRMSTLNYRPVKKS